MDLDCIILNNRNILKTQLKCSTGNWRGKKKEIDEIKDKKIEISRLNKIEKIDWGVESKQIEQQSLNELWDSNKKLTGIPSKCLVGSGK